jgi:G3E family GTPase
VVATFDCLRGADAVGFQEAAAQWAGAQALVLTKRDLASPAQVAAARGMARGVNPVAEIVDCDDRRSCVLAAFEPRPPSPLVLPDVAGFAHPRIAVLLVRWTATPAWDELAAWLDNLAGLLGERLLRVKGVVAVAELAQPLLVQSVGTMFSAPRPFAGPVDAPFLVVIARDASSDEVAQVSPVLPLTISRLGMPDPFVRRSAEPLRAV